MILEFPDYSFMTREIVVLPDSYVDQNLKLHHSLWGYHYSPVAPFTNMD